MGKTKWACPICGNNAYERHGGYPEPAYRIIENEDGSKTEQPITYMMGKHFMCKGCSVFFSNPRKFNAVKEQPPVEVKDTHRVIDSWQEVQRYLDSKRY